MLAAAVLGVAVAAGGPTAMGPGGLEIPRLLEPRVAAHIERGRIAMRKLEEMFAKHPTLQSQEVKVLSLLRWLRASPADMYDGAVLARGPDVPLLLKPPVAGLIHRLFEYQRLLQLLLVKEPSAEQEVGTRRPAHPARHRKIIFFLPKAWFPTTTMAATKRPS